MTEVNDCSNCRHHQKQPRAKPTGWQNGAHFELADEVQDLYRCGAPEGPHAGAEVGLVPITCTSFEPGVKEPLPQSMGSAYDAWQARMAAREKRENER